MTLIERIMARFGYYSKNFMFYMHCKSFSDGMTAALKIITAPKNNVDCKVIDLSDYKRERGL